MASNINDLPEYGVRREDSWVLDSPAQRILREGYTPPRFHSLLAKFHRDDEPRSRRLHSICARLELVEQFKHTLRVSSAKPGPLKYQVERLINYLTLTCLEIVAGPNWQYQPFPRWLADQADKPPSNWSSEFVKAISNLEESALSIQHRLQRYLHLFQEEFNSHQRVARRLAQSIGILYNGPYLDRFGLRRNIKQLVKSDLPDWIRNWLAETYFIVKGDVIYIAITKPQSIDWLEMSIDEKLDRIADHLYQSRNMYTHTVVHHPSMEKSGTVSIPIEGVEYRFDFIKKDDDFPSPIEWSVGIRNGIPESEIVRLLIVVELRRWISIEDTVSLIDTYMKRSKYRELAYGFLSELEFNIDLILSWARALLIDSWPIYSSVIFRSLSIANAQRFLEYDEKSYRGIRFEITPRYLRVISELNKLLDSLRTETTNLAPWQASRLASSSLRELLERDQTKVLMNLLEDYERLIEDVLEKPFY